MTRKQAITPGRAAGADKGDAHADSRQRFEAYSRLQAAAVAFGEQLPIPEIVAIGGQSDGKSSLLEAFLGFRFNVREVEMGTRRPLIVQMVHDPSALEPRCRLQDEDSEDYGPVIVPETAVADAIVRRTEEHLRRLGGVSVSAKPIVLKAEFAYSPNLTIIDTPGFILKSREGEPDSTPQDILAMVKAQAAAPHRLILFLQQSSVEWANSQWLSAVQEVDPQLQRTLIVASKFDNRLKEFSERWEVDKYLAATGYLPPGVRPFFVALPKDRAVQCSADWRAALGEVDAAVFRQLREGVKGGFDEEAFAPRVGFGALKCFLEEELARRYREAAPSMLALLHERCQAAAAELAAAQARLKAASDVAALRRASMQHAAALSRRVEALLEGATEPDPATHGLTSEEEGAASRMPHWPGVPAAVKPPNAGLRLFGGAAFERCLNEFQEAAHALKFPAAVAAEKVANVLLAYKGRNSHVGAARAAEDIARQAARELLGPLLDNACSRLGYVLRRAVDIATALEAQLPSGGGSEGGGRELQPYVSFHAALRSANQAFLGRLEAECRQLVRHHLDAATSEYAVNLLVSGGAGGWEAEEEGDDGEEERDQADGMTTMMGGDATMAHVTIGRGRAGGAGGLLARQPPSQGTIPETPEMLPGGQQQQGDATVVITAGRHVDINSPGKGRAAKAARTGQPRSLAAYAGNPLYEGRGTYEDVLRYAERLFNRIRRVVACQATPSTLKAAFLGPIKERLATEVALELFAKSDADFMAMFSAASALAALTARREALQRRCEGLTKSKTEFAELLRTI